jgi:hypothetical protein
MAEFGDIVLALHLIGTVVTVGVVVVTDALTLVAKMRSKAIKIVVFLSPFLSLLVWAGFLVLSVSGILLLVLGRGTIDDPMFKIKMLFVGIVFVNGILLNHRIEPQSATYVQQGIFELPRAFKRRAMLSAIVSMVGWWGATFTAYFLVS